MAGGMVARGLRVGLGARGHVFMQDPTPKLGRPIAQFIFATVNTFMNGGGGIARFIVAFGGAVLLIFILGKVGIFRKT